MSGGGFADFLNGLQQANEEVDVRDKAVEQRRQITERYHAAIERGRHPRSFGRVNDLWRHIKNAEGRRTSVARGQRLRRVSSLPTELTPIKVKEEKRVRNVKRRSLNSAASSDDNSSDYSDDLDDSDDGNEAYVTTRQHGYNNSNSLKSRSNSYGGNNSRASSRGQGNIRDRTRPTGVLNMAALKAERKGKKDEKSVPPSREAQYQIRPTSGDETDVVAQLQKQKRIEEKHGSVERRTHKLGRKMSMFRINDAAIKDLPRMVGRREMQGGNLVANGGKKSKKYSQDELSSVPPEIAQARRRKMKKKRYTQRLVGLDGRGESEYDPTPDKVERVESRRQSYFGTFPVNNNNNSGNNASTLRVPKGLAPEIALKQIDSQKKSIIDLEASTTSLGEGGNEETKVSSSSNNNKSNDGVAQQKVQLRAKKKEVLPEFTSILNATVFYGSVVALQMSDGKYLTVMEDTGEIKAHHWPGVEKYGIRQKATHPGPDAQNGRMLFTLYDMRNPGNQEPIKYGDPVWFAVCAGNGGGRAKGTPTPPSAWKLGSCISARIMKAPQLATIGLESSSIIRNPDKETVNVGSPVPLPCVVQSTGGKGGGKELWLQGPITKENQNGWYSKKDLIYEKLYKEKNAAAMSLGRWFMLPIQLANQESIRRSKASYAARTVIEGLLEGQNKSHLDGPNGYENKELINGTEIYLERDWFYISGNPSKVNRDQIIVRQLPGTNEDSALSPDNKKKFKKLLSSKKGKGGDSVDKELEVDRRGVFKIRLISGGQRPKGQNKEQQKVEATFHMARQQLKKSRAFRNGDTVEYEDGNIKGGEKFSMQVRLIHQDVDLNNDNKFLSYEDDKLTRLESYFEDLYENSPVRILDNNPVRMRRGRIRSSSIHSLARSRTSRGSVASVKARPIKSRNTRMLKLLHQSVSGPHINLWDPDRMVSARLHKEARDEQQTREEQSRQENRLSRLMKYASLPDDELPSRSASLAGSRPTSKASSRPVSRAVPRMKEENKDVVSDDAVAKLLGIDKHTRPMNDVLGDEDDSMKTTISASQQVEYRIRTAKRRKREASRRKKNEHDRKSRLLQAEIEKAEVAAKLHEIGQKRAEAAAKARAEAERQRLS
jgi:hypothetical protein